MILVDSSIWVDHLRAGDEELMSLLRREEVLTHPFIIGEVALGNLRQRETDLGLMQDLPSIEAAADQEVLQLINGQRLFGLGIGYVDAHLLAALRLIAGSLLWTRNRRMAEAARRLGLALKLPH